MYNLNIGFGKSVSSVTRLAGDFKLELSFLRVTHDSILLVDNPPAFKTTRLKSTCKQTYGKNLLVNLHQISKSEMSMQ